MRDTIIVAALLVLSSVASAQGWVKLTDGRRIEGEVIFQDKKHVDIIDMIGVRHRFSRDEVDKLKEGKGLSKKTEEMMEGVHIGDPDAIYVVALKVLKMRSGKKDGERLLRRVLALDDVYPGVREMLGHYQALDQWFENEKEAKKVIDAHYEAEGFIKFKGGWLQPEQEGIVKDNSDEWMIHEGTWQPVEDVMLARGYVAFRDGWLPPDQKDYVRFAEIIENEGGQKMDGAQVGTVVVLHYKGAEYSKKLAQKLMDGRSWFAENYEKPSCVRNPIWLEVIFEKEADWSRARSACLVSLGIASPDTGKFGGMPGGGKETGVGFKDMLGGISHDELPDIPLPPGAVGAMDFRRPDFEEAHLMINVMGSRLMSQFWDAKEFRSVGEWLVRASSVHSEIAAMGSTQVLQSASEENYDRRGNNDFDGNIDATLDDLKAKLKETLKRRKLSLRTIIFAPIYQLDGDTDQYTVTLLAWMLEYHRDKLIKYVHDTTRDLPADERIKKHFGIEVEGLEKEFRTWLGA